MVKERMDLLELLHKGGMDGDVDFLREALRVLVEGIMDAEVSSRIGAEYGERSPERVTQRNGYRSRAWDTRVGTMELHIPKLREGSYFPSLLEPRRSRPVKWCKSASSCCCCLGGCRLREIGLRKSFVEGQNGGCEVSTSDDPFVVLLSQDGANEAAHGRPVRRRCPPHRCVAGSPC